MSPAEFNAHEIAAGRLTREHVAVIDAHSTAATFELRVKEWQAEHGLAADGMAGKLTRASTESEVPAPVPTAPAQWPTFTPPIARPKNRAAVYAAFGDPGKATESAAWKRANVVDCNGTGGKYPALPGCPLVGAGRYVAIHRLVEPIFREGLRRATLAVPDHLTKFGCQNFRHMRHDPDLPLSYHSWGIAGDTNPGENKAITFAPGKCPALWSPEWVKLWPKGLPRAFVEAMESVGLVWGGRWTSFVDPMHWQYVG